MIWSQFVLSALSVAGMALSAIMYVQLKKLWGTHKSAREKLQELQKFKRSLELRNHQIEFLTRESERERIAGALHDEIGSSLTAIKFNIQSLYRLLDPENRPAIVFNDIFRLVDDVTKRYKEIVKDISPATLERFGLSTAIKEICRSFNDSIIIRVRFTEQGVQNGFWPYITSRPTFQIFR